MSRGVVCCRLPFTGFCVVEVWCYVVVCCSVEVLFGMVWFLWYFDLAYCGVIRSDLVVLECYAVWNVGLWFLCVVLVVFGIVVLGY